MFAGLFIIIAGAQHALLSPDIIAPWAGFASLREHRRPWPYRYPEDQIYGLPADHSQPVVSRGD
jgi:hypothetical protein